MEELSLLIKSRYPIICVESHEEERLSELLERFCRDLKLAFFTWSVAEGLCRRELGQPAYESQDPMKALQHIDSSGLPAVYLLRDVHPYLNDPRLVRRLREIAQASTKREVTLVLSAPSLTLPLELRPLSAQYHLSLPDEKELRSVVRETFRDLSRNKDYAFRLQEEELGRLVRNLKGLTLDQARRAISRAVLDDGILDARDIAHALSAKKECIQQSGVLEYFEIEKELPQLGGLTSLKAWLRRFPGRIQPQGAPTRAASPARCNAGGGAGLRQEPGGQDHCPRMEPALAAARSRAAPRQVHR